MLEYNRHEVHISSRPFASLALNWLYRVIPIVPIESPRSGGICSVVGIREEGGREALAHFPKRRLLAAVSRKYRFGRTMFVGKGLYTQIHGNWLWGFGDSNGKLLTRMRVCCNSEPAIVELADFLASHDAFLVYGGPRSADRLQYFVNDGATVETKRISGEDYLVLVTYKKRSMQQPFR